MNGADLAKGLAVATGYPSWRQHPSRWDGAVLWFGRAIPGPGPYGWDHAAVVWYDQGYHVDVLQYTPDVPRALRVPGALSWLDLVEFIVGLVEEFGEPEGSEKKF